MAADIHTEAGRRGAVTRFRTQAQRIAALVPVVAITAVWAVVVRDAWRLRSVVVDYESVHGEARWPSNAGPWPEHLRQFHDALLRVGADYYYPFGPGVLVFIALVWACALAVAAAFTGVQRFGRILAGLGLAALATQLVLFAGPLTTYVRITE